MKLRLLALLALGVALFALQSLADGENSQSDAKSTAAIVIMKDMAFDPPEITVPAGSTVRWENHERRQFHNVWFRELGEDPGPYLFPEEYMERTFDQAGVFPYVCQPHEGRGMTGVVIVVDEPADDAQTGSYK